MVGRCPVPIGTLSPSSEEEDGILVLTTLGVPLNSILPFQ